MTDTNPAAQNDSAPTTTEQMRRVIQHTSKKIDQAIDAERAGRYPQTEVLLGLAYASGVLDLLSAYLVVDTDSAEGE